MQAGGLPVHGEGGWAQPQTGLLAEGQWTRDQDQEETGIFAGRCTLVSFAILGGCGCGFCFFLVA